MGRHHRHARRPDAEAADARPARRGGVFRQAPRRGRTRTGAARGMLVLQSGLLRQRPAAGRISRHEAMNEAMKDKISNTRYEKHCLSTVSLTDAQPRRRPDRDLPAGERHLLCGSRRHVGLPKGAVQARHLLSPKRREAIQDRGVVVAPNYQLSPRAHNPQYTEDAAAAVAWTVLSTVTAFME